MGAALGLGVPIASPCFGRQDWRHRKDGGSGRPPAGSRRPEQLRRSEPVSREPIGPDVAHGLEPRHLRVLELLLEGKDNAHIAESLALSRRTVENYVSEILTILSCQSRAQVIARYDWSS